MVLARLSDTDKQFDWLSYRCARVFVVLLFVGFAVFANFLLFKVASSMTGTAVTVPFSRGFEKLNMIWFIFCMVCVVAALVVLVFPSVSLWWVCKRMCAGEERSNRFALFLIAIILPFNFIWFFDFIGYPVLQETCRVYKQEGDKFFMSALGQRYPPEAWVEAEVSRLPGQIDCNTILDVALDGFWGLPGNRWEEVFIFALRFFGFSAGVLATAMLESFAGGFLEDFIDIFDLYMMAFANVSLMKVGKPSFSVDPVFLTFDFNHTVGIVLIVAYLLLFLRVAIGNGKVTCCRVQFKVGHACSLVMSLSQELSFLVVRVYAGWHYEVPVSVLVLKNMASIFWDIQDFWTITHLTSVPPPPSQKLFESMSQSLSDVIASDSEEASSLSSETPAGKL